MLAAGYTKAKVLKAACVPSALHLLKISTDLEESMLSRATETASSAELVDLIRLFLLHRVLPLNRVIQLLGVEACSVLLEVRALSCCQGVSVELLEPAEASRLCDQLRKSHSDHRIFSNVAVWPMDQDLLVA